MKINLSHSLVKELKLDNLSSSEDELKHDFVLEVQTMFDSENPQKFVVVFDATILSPEEYKLNMVYISIFSTDEDIDETFMNSHFPSINAPAIAFPFLRSLITTITVNSGYEPAILPSINFTKFKNKSVFLDDKKIEPAKVDHEDDKQSTK